MSDDDRYAMQIAKEIVVAKAHGSEGLTNMAGKLLAQALDDVFHKVKELMKES